MPQFIVVGDLHLTAELLDKFDGLFNTLSTFDCPIIFLGDVFHYRGTFSGKFLVDVNSLFTQLGSPVVIVAGNHDLVYNDRTILELFQKPNIKVVNRVLVEPPYAYIAYTTDTNILSEISQHNIKYIFSHLPIAGHPQAWKAKFSPDSFENYIVFNGHWHTPYRQTNIIYPGSIYHVTKAEIGNPTGFYIVNDDAITRQDVLILHRVRVDQYDPQYDTPYHVIYTDSMDVAKQYTKAYNVIVEAVKPVSEAALDTTISENSFWDDIKSQLISYLLDRGFDNDIIDTALTLLPDEVLKHWGKESSIEQLLAKFEHEVANIKVRLDEFDKQVNELVRAGDANA